MMRALLGVSCLLAMMGNDPAMSPGPVKSAASVARMSKAISGSSLAEDSRMSLHSCRLLAVPNRFVVGDTQTAQALFEANRVK
jgi:hypothetical protein